MRLRVGEVEHRNVERRVLGILYGSPASSLTTHQDTQLLGFLE
jgi:hypothetical protein